MRSHRRLTHVAVLLCAVGLSALAVGLVFVLHARASDNRRAEVTLANLTTSLNELAPIAFTADAAEGGSPERARVQLVRTEAKIDATLATLRGGSSNAALARVAPRMHAAYAQLERIRRLDGSGHAPAALALGAPVQDAVTSATGDLLIATHDYERAAAASLRQAAVGSAAAILVLLAGFALFYRRSWRLLDTNAQLLVASRTEASTDVLTGLGNRRAFMTHLEQAVDDAEPRVLVLLDLDGFKGYNDAFGHPAGDALLARLAGRLTAAIGDVEATYRIGGDEFCVVARIGGRAGDAATIAASAAAALSEQGEAFAISCSGGIALLPDEAPSPAAALALADARMYVQKSRGRISAERQSTDVLLKVLSECDPGLERHVHGVGRLAVRVAERLGLAEEDIVHIRAAAELHDVGKLAIPDSILDKPGPLDDAEREFVRRHTIIGERILIAAPALVPSAALVRSSHERFDGTGYPDRLRRTSIPLGARIIAVCDSFDAMVSDRTYRRALGRNAAIAELRRCCGTQFDPDVVAAFEALGDDPGLEERTPATVDAGPVAG